MRKMKIYVAGAWGSTAEYMQPIKDAQLLLVRRGHVITHDWTTAELPPV